MRLSLVAMAVNVSQGNQMKTIHTVDEYLSALPKASKDKIEVLRRTIRQAAPEAEEVISYNIPSFKWNGMLVWYAAFKKHIGFYPKSSAISAFKHKLTPYKTSKGAIQFPIEEPIPEELVKEIVRFRVRENEKAKAKS